MSSKTMKVLKVQDSSIHLTFQISEKLIKHNKIQNLVYSIPNKFGETAQPQNGRGCCDRQVVWSAPTNAAHFYRDFFLYIFGIEYG